MKKYIFSRFFSPYCIKIGSERVVVIDPGKKKVFDEPAFVAVSRETEEIIAFGTQARELSTLGTSEIEIRSLFSEGFITDEKISSEYLLWVRKQIAVKSLWRIIPIPAVFVTSIDSAKPYERLYAQAARAAHFLPVAFIAGIYGDNQSIKDEYRGRTRAIIHLGGTLTQVALFSETTLVRSICLSVGGSNIDEQLQARVYRDLGIHVPVAHFVLLKEAYTKAYGSGLQFSSVLRGKEKKTGKIISLQMKQNIVEEVVRQFFKELFESILLQFETQKATTWFLTGGLSVFPEASDEFERLTGSKPELVSRPSIASVLGVANLIAAKNL